jgi:uncharacterized protein YlzI (FlbEa/FlbD family)
VTIIQTADGKEIAVEGEVQEVANKVQAAKKRGLPMVPFTRAGKATWINPDQICSLA